jgi:hypothetical protein
MLDHHMWVIARNQHYRYFKNRVVLGSLNPLSFTNKTKKKVQATIMHASVLFSICKG